MGNEFAGHSMFIPADDCSVHQPQGTLRLANANTRAGGLRDIFIRDGRIAALTEPGSARCACPSLDLEGALVTPSFVDGHVHLDKTHMGMPLVPHVSGTEVRQRIAAERALRRKLTPVRERARALIRRLLANGTTRIRSHVDIDSDVGLAHLEALLALRQDMARLIDIQLVAFPQSGIMHEPGMPDLLDAALAAGADLIGGLDPLGIDKDVKGHLDVVFHLAEKHGKGVDIHLHDGGEAGGVELCDIAARTVAAGLEGKVVVSHAFALGMLDERSFGTTADALARAGVAIMTSSPPPVPVPPVRRLERHGVRVFAASDNIRDCWSPFGNGDMLERAGIVATRQQLFTNEDIGLAFDMAGVIPAGVLGLSGYGLDIGAQADLVALDVPDVVEAVLARPVRRLVLRAGEVIARNGMLEPGVA